MVFHPSKFFCYLQIDSGAFTAFLVTVNGGLPICITFFCYFKIIKTVRSHSSNLKNTRNGTSAVNVEEIKVARTVFVIVLFFSFCWTPVLLIDLVDIIYGSWTFPLGAYVAYSFLATVSSALNPIIYGVLNKNYKDQYLKILRCSHCRSQTVVEPFIVERLSREY